jgi:hypothetical protein
MAFTLLDTATICELIDVPFTPDPIAADWTPVQIAAAIEYGPQCEEHGCACVLCWQQHPSAGEVLVWAQRIYPYHPDPHDYFSFAELVASHAAILASGWGALENERPRDVAAYRMLHRAHVEAGTPYEDVLTVTGDERGQHAPLPGISLEAWTREMFRRLVGYYFQGEPLPGA